MSSQPPPTNKPFYPNVAATPSGTIASPPAFNPVGSPPPLPSPPMMRSPPPLPQQQPIPQPVVYAQQPMIQQPIMQQPTVIQQQPVLQQPVYYAMPQQPATSTVVISNPGMYRSVYQPPVTTTTIQPNGSTTTTTYIQQQPTVMYAPYGTVTGLGYAVDGFVSDVNRLFNPGYPYVYRRW